MVDCDVQKLLVQVITHVNFVSNLWNVVSAIENVLLCALIITTFFPVILKYALQ